VRIALLAGRSRQLPAGALVLVVVISLIIAAILLALVFLTTARRQQLQQDARRQTVRRNAYSGLAYIQARERLPYFRRQTWDLFGEENDSVSIEKRPWGVFDVAIVVAFRQRQADTLRALLGSQFAPSSVAALTLSDDHIPLSVNGDAQVRGTVRLPGATPVRAANLPLLGPARTGAPVTGSIQAVQPTAVTLDDSARARLRAYANLQLAAWLPPGSVPTGALRSGITSFMGPATVFYQNAPVELQHIQLGGQVVVISSRRLIVDASAQLDNVLLLAPVVIIKAGFRGRVQVIARDTAELQAGCELLYPSAVCACSPTQAAQVVLGPASRVSGVVLAAQGESNMLPRVRMAPDAAVQGQLFSAGTVENCGLVQGTVACRRLVYRTSATFYDNYLVNCTLDRLALPPAFLTTPLLNAEAATGIVAWLP
jgi:hypothetical protein